MRSEMLTELHTCIHVNLSQAANSNINTHDQHTVRLKYAAEFSTEVEQITERCIKRCCESEYVPLLNFATSEVSNMCRTTR